MVVKDKDEAVAVRARMTRRVGRHTGVTWSEVLEVAASFEALGCGNRAREYEGFLGER